MTGIVPGETLIGDEPVEINAGRETTTLTVENTGDRPVQVGSHFHFFETNPALAFDREWAYGFRLDVPAGTAVRFEPGTEREVDLVAIGGNRVVHGMGGLVAGELDDDEVRTRALELAADRGYLSGEGAGSLDDAEESPDDGSSAEESPDDDSSVAESAATGAEADE